MNWFEHPRALALGWAGGLISAAVAAGIAAAAIVFGGAYNTTALAHHPSLIAWAIHRTMISSVGARAPTAAPNVFTTAQMQIGGQIYMRQCLDCHGGPGVARGKWVSGIYPTPPYLLAAACDWSPSQLHFIVADGVKMTAMPAWRDQLTDAQIWDLVAFLEALPSMSPIDFARMRQNANMVVAGGALPFARAPCESQR